ncbi:MAG: uracil-DNA glycosylase [Clostridia bacterium]|nr:uracil-DNA glycosylase [Clostridia bacterium]
MRNWDDFLAACDGCRACPLSETRTRVVVWRGSVQAPLLFIGEGPGAEEDRQGLPFVGAAGRLLDLGLEAFDLTGGLVHIANIVKCRPPGNRVPTEEEARACRPLLAAQFKFVRPRIIVLLGATAYKNFTGLSEGITKARGKWIEKGGYLILPTLHPAYILRNGREKIHLWNDLAAARAKLEELGLAPPLDRRD